MKKALGMLSICMALLLYCATVCLAEADLSLRGEADMLIEDDLADVTGWGQGLSFDLTAVARGTVNYGGGFFLELKSPAELLYQPAADALFSLAEPYLALGWKSDAWRFAVLPYEDDFEIGWAMPRGHAAYALPAGTLAQIAFTPSEALAFELTAAAGWGSDPAYGAAAALHWHLEDMTLSLGWQQEFKAGLSELVFGFAEDSDWALRMEVAGRMLDGADYGLASYVQAAYRDQGLEVNLEYEAKEASFGASLVPQGWREWDLTQLWRAVAGSGNLYHLTAGFYFSDDLAIRIEYADALLELSPSVLAGGSSLSLTGRKNLGLFEFSLAAAWLRESGPSLPWQNREIFSYELGLGYAARDNVKISIALKQITGTESTRLFTLRYGYGF